jgi:hypothetical protein
VTFAGVDAQNWAARAVFGSSRASRAVLHWHRRARCDPWSGQGDRCNPGRLRRTICLASTSTASSPRGSTRPNGRPGLRRHGYGRTPPRSIRASRSGSTMTSSSTIRLRNAPGRGRGDRAGIRSAAAAGTWAAAVGVPALDDNRTSRSPRWRCPGCHRPRAVRDLRSAARRRPPPAPNGRRSSSAPPDDVDVAGPHGLGSIWTIGPATTWTSWAPAGSSPAGCGRRPRARAPMRPRGGDASHQSQRPTPRARVSSISRGAPQGP